MQRVGANPSCHWTRGRVIPGQVTGSWRHQNAQAMAVFQSTVDFGLIGQSAVVRLCYSSVTGLVIMCQQWRMQPRFRPLCRLYFLIFVLCCNAMHEFTVWRVFVMKHKTGEQKSTVMHRVLRRVHECTATVRGSWTFFFLNLQSKIEKKNTITQYLRVDNDLCLTFLNSFIITVFLRNSLLFTPSFKHAYPVQGQRGGWSLSQHALGPSLCHRAVFYTSTKRKSSAQVGNAADVNLLSFHC